MIYYEISLKRQDEPEVKLGTCPTMDAVDEWFSGAFINGILPDPPKYTDEIRVYEVQGIIVDDNFKENRRDMLYVWRVSWHMFEAKRLSIV
jgi:hypothetical protein